VSRRAVAQKPGHDDCKCRQCSGAEPQRPTGNPDPGWYGYDPAKVARVHCLACGEPIGRRPYLEDRAWARFGSMSFVHRECAEGGQLSLVL